MREFAPDVAVSDILTPAPALAAELEGVPVATLVPHVYPYLAPGFPPYSIGARLPRTRLGRAAVAATRPALVARGARAGPRRVQRVPRAGSGCRRCRGVHTGLSRALTMVGDAAAARVPARVAAVARVVGPLHVGAARASASTPPPGDGPVVLVAPSTAQDPEHRLLRAALDGPGATSRCA